MKIARHRKPVPHTHWGELFKSDLLMTPHHPSRHATSCLRCTGCISFVFVLSFFLICSVYCLCPIYLKPATSSCNHFPFQICTLRPPGSFQSGLILSSKVSIKKSGPIHPEVYTSPEILHIFSNVSSIVVHKRCDWWPQITCQVM